MDKLAKDPYETKVFVFFDFPAWVESKIQKKLSRNSTAKV